MGVHCTRMGVHVLQCDHSSWRLDASVLAKIQGGAHSAIYTKFKNERRIFSLVIGWPSN